MRDKDQKSLEELYENRILSEISSEYYNSPDKGKKKEQPRKGYLFSQKPKSTRGLKPQVNGSFITADRIDLEQIEDPQEIREYKNSINDLRGKIVYTAQDPDVPTKYKDKLETLLNDRNLCMEIVKDIVLGIRSDDKYVKLMKPEEYPNGDPIFIIVQDGEDKNILVLGIKGKFISGVTKHSDIKYKIV
jgi:hypothetical protein